MKSHFEVVYLLLMRKSIQGYEGHYEVDASGFIFSIKSGKFLKGHAGNSEYLQVSLSKNGIVKPVLVHRLVALAFIPNPENKGDVNHKDFNRLNNNVTNLEWCTRSENQLHAAKKPNRVFTSPMKGKFGSEHNRSKVVYEFDENKNLIGEYESGLDFQRKTGKHHSSVSWSIKNGKPIYGNYYSRTL